MATATLDMRTLADNLSDMSPEDQAPPPLGNDLRVCRVHVLKLSQKELGALCAVSETTISNWERGRTTPKPVEAARLRQVLNDLEAARQQEHAGSQPVEIAESELAEIRDLLAELKAMRTGRVPIDEATDAQLLAEQGKRLADRAGSGERPPPRNILRVQSAPEHIAAPPTDPEGQRHGDG